MNGNGGRKTVLVVDDVPDDIAILEEILKGEYQVKAVTNGEAALAIAGGDVPPDLILLDIMMPGMDGFEVCRNIKADAAGATIPIIFLTARLLYSDEKAAFDMGAVDYIRKPVDPDVVLARVKAHLEQKDALVRASEVRYRRLFETSVDGCMIVDVETGRIVDANPSMAKLLGLTQESFLSGRVSDLGVLDGVLYPSGRTPMLERREPVRTTAVPVDTADGRRIYVEAICNPYRVNRRETVQLSLRDMTELTEAQRSRDALSARLAHYLVTSPTITYSIRLEGGAADLGWISENVAGLLGYSVEEAMAPEWWFRNVHPDDRVRALSGISELTKGERYTHEYRFMKKDRTAIWLFDDMRLLRGDDGTLEIVGTLTDISERKRAEEELRRQSDALEAALREKSALLREIHHRVKNNMQVVSSLLSLSAAAAGDPAIASTLAAVIRRIGTMALAHEQFYESESLERIDFARYLRGLAADLIQEGGAAAMGTRLEFDADPVELSLEEAIPAGLIASELISNSVRHALVDPGRPGTLRISMRQADSAMTLSFSDDGPGLPAGVDPDSGGTLGMRLIGILAEQLRGEVAFVSTGRGTSATLRFPILG